jgi:hypothetical protein
MPNNQAFIRKTVERPPQLCGFMPSFFPGKEFTLSF